MKTIGERIAHARSLIGLSAAELGRLAGMSHGVVTMIETGARKNPATGTIVKLAKVLGVSTDWLISGTGKPPTKQSVRTAAEQAGWEGDGKDAA